MTPPPPPQVTGVLSPVEPGSPQGPLCPLHKVKLKIHVENELLI